MTTITESSIPFYWQPPEVQKYRASGLATMAPNRSILREYGRQGCPEEISNVPRTSLLKLAPDFMHSSPTSPVYWGGADWGRHGDKIAATKAWLPGALVR